ncbi:MAG: yvyI [Mucilaginibacter sp.]|nr:yvyI [Mucilaginibacter sp.]
MSEIKLYPLKFEPIYQYRIWGGRRLANLLSKPLPADELIGEAWILSDRDDHPSKVTEGPLKGQTISQLVAAAPVQLFGKELVAHFKRFPLLLKFLDAQKVLSVQVHPSDDKKKYIPAGESGKTEAWVVLQKGAKGLIYAGLKPGTTENSLRQSLAKHTVADDLSSFKPKVGESVFIKAGTVHTLQDLVVFEVQENSDVTYRLYDWDRVDEKTGKPRDLQVEEAIACIDFNQINIGPVKPVVEKDDSVLREKIFNSDKFSLWRLTGKSEFRVGKEATPRILVCVEGRGEVKSNGDSYKLSKGEVMLLPAIVGACRFLPDGEITLLEIALPEIK